MKNWIGMLTLGLTIGFSSCLKEELPIPKVEKGSLTTASVTMGSKYKKQIYFNLNQNKIVKEHDKEIWDLGFETSPEGWHIITNTGKNMYVYTTDEMNLTDIESQNGYTANASYDSPTGDMDSTGIGDWQDGKIRILDMGYDSNDQELGWYKLQVVGVDENGYEIQYAEVSSNDIQTAFIEKDEDYTFSYYSLLNQEQVEVAPKKGEWDLVFRQLIVHLTQPLVMDYLVTGCLTNPNGTSSLMLKGEDFDEMDLEYAKTFDFSTQINEIGYNWKDVGIENVMNGGTADYTVYDDRFYLIKTQNNQYFKLKFISFYSETGEKGTPTFEYQELF